jgi:glycosyltransferase involved in cell wall biosynthesis
MNKSDKRILIIGSYPITKPRHGGQKRVQAVVKEYQKHFTNVKFIAVFSRWANPDHGSDDIPVSHQTDREIMRSARLEDIICGEAIYNESKVKQSVTQVLRTYRPDVIQLEQAYPYLGLKPLLKELGMSPQIIFDTHNVESEMKPSIYKEAGLKDKEATALIARITDLESDLLANSALTVAVSAADEAVFKHAGARRVIIARNGIYPVTSAEANRRYWLNFFKENRINHRVLYVSSAHLPNWTGLQKMIGDGLGFLSPDTRILIAGGLSDYLTTRHIWPETPGAATFWCRAEGCGILTEDRLGGLIQASDMMILPIFTGGGSNLKTAEALLSGKPIVATSYAFRAYEQFMDLPTVTIADTPKDFQQGILNTIKASSPRLTNAQIQSLQAVTWPNCLSDLIAEVAKI